MALAERVLPKTSVSLTANRKGAGLVPASAQIWADDPPLTFGNPKPLGWGRGANPAIALCIALLKAQLNGPTKAGEQ